MEFTKTTTTVSNRKIIALRYPYSQKDSILKIRKETSCWFCSKKYVKSEAFGLVMTDKGSTICCDDCCMKFDTEGVVVYKN